MKPRKRRGLEIIHLHFAAVLFSFFLAFFGIVIMYGKVEQRKGMGLMFFGLRIMRYEGYFTEFR
jgi:hypothetical protein